LILSMKAFCTQRGFLPMGLKLATLKEISLRTGNPARKPI
jgi:hypothetical protein